MPRFEKHIFICENKREGEHPKGCCADKGSHRTIELFKKRIKELGLNRNVRINRSGCLDACEFGLSIVVYPEQTWYGNVKEADVEEIIQSHILNNLPVKRLLIKDKRFNEIS